MERARIFGCVVVILGLLMALGGFGYVFTTEDTYSEYRYEVKAEQVNQNEMVNDSVNYDELSDGEREMLYRAFKESDHFLGGAEAYVTTDEPVEGLETDTWKVVRVEGVPILMAIIGPEKHTYITDSAFGAAMVGTVGVIMVLMMVWVSVPVRESEGIK